MSGLKLLQYSTRSIIFDIKMAQNLPKGLRELLNKHPAFVLSNYMVNIINSLLILLLDNYPVTSRGISEGLHQLASYRNHQEVSSPELKNEIISFIARVTHGRIFDY